MSAPSSRRFQSFQSSTVRGSSCKRKSSKGDDDVQRNRPPPPRHHASRFSEGLEDTQSKGVGQGEPGITFNGGRDNLDFQIGTKLYSVDRGESIVEGGGATVTPVSRSFCQETSNTGNPAPHNSCVRTDGGAYIGTANISGGSHVFGNDSTQINNILTIIRIGDGQFTEDQKNFIGDYIAKHSASSGINDELNKSFLTQLIINLPRAEAVFNDYKTQKKSGPCFEGTRVALLREMADWVTGQSESRMYILSGLAGIGKSTVAYTIASRTADLNLLGASFFFSRDEADRNNAKKLFTTIAYQLCVYSEAFAKAIGHVLQTKRGSAATTKDPQEQLQALIVEPLRNVVQTRARPILVVVDALDECEEEDCLSVLNGLSQLVRDLSSFKVILTTRPQPHINRFFDNHDGHEIFRLQDIEDKVVDSDVRIYLKHCLSLQQVQIRFRRREWHASDEEIDILVCAVGRLFIIAATAVRFILDKNASNPATQMRKLLHASAQNRMPFKDLNEFYTIILRSVISVDCDDDDIVNRYQSVIGAIIFVQHPLPVTTLAHLIDIDAEDIRSVLDNLQCIILLGDDDIPRVYHKSFPDYVTDPSRCKSTDLCINQRIRHTQITIRCFQIMEQHLKYNILDLGYPARFMSNEDGLAKEGITDKQLQTKISPQLQYACVYWGNHIKVTNIEATGLMKELEKFADHRMLPWFEALSLIKELDSAHRAIRAVLKYIRSPSSDLHRLLLDGLRFISKFYEVVERSALHTYYSGLAFMPTDSILYHRYVNMAIHDICHVIGRPDKWDSLIANLKHGDKVDDIQFSLDNIMLASWHKKRGEGVLKVWDAATGTPISTIRGSGFAIANDFSTVASFEGKTITLYTVVGAQRGATFTTPANIFEVAISSEISRMAAGLTNNTVCLWESRTNELLGTYDDYKFSYNKDYLKFSATGTRLVYSSVGGVVKLRDGTDGRLISNLDCKSTHVVFSRDGSRIACLRPASRLRLWSCEDGVLIGIAEKAGSELAISVNGCFLATAGKEKIRLWRGDSGNPLPLVDTIHHLRLPWSIVFSADDALVIATDFEIKFYHVKSYSFIFTLSFTAWYPEAIALSSDCSRLAARRTCGTVCLWDIRGIEASNSATNKHRISALALSKDCLQVACGFEDGAIDLLDTVGFAKRRIASHITSNEVRVLGFSLDDRQFASGSINNTVNLWHSQDGTLCGTVQHHREYGGPLRKLEVSNNVLATMSQMMINLWDTKTLDRIHLIEGRNFCDLSFSANGVYLAACDNFRIFVFNVTLKSTTIAMFNVPKFEGRIGFLPDNSRLVTWDDFRLFSLDNRDVVQRPTFEDVTQMPNMLLWHGVPVWVSRVGEQDILRALFPQHNHPVPVLWIPRELEVWVRAQGRSIIALGCRDGRVVLLRLPSMTSEKGKLLAAASITASSTSTSTTAGAQKAMNTEIRAVSGYPSCGVLAQQTAHTISNSPFPPITAESHTTTVAAAMPYVQNTYAPAAVPTEVQGNDNPFEEMEARSASAIGNFRDIMGEDYLVDTTAAAAMPYAQNTCASTVPTVSTSGTPIMVRHHRPPQPAAIPPPPQHGANATYIWLPHPSNPDNGRWNNAPIVTNNWILSSNMNLNRSSATTSSSSSTFPSPGHVSPSLSGSMTLLIVLSSSPNSVQQHWPPMDFPQGTPAPLFQQAPHHPQNQPTPSQLEYSVQADRSVLVDWTIEPYPEPVYEPDAWSGRDWSQPQSGQYALPSEEYQRYLGYGFPENTGYGYGPGGIP